MHGKLQDGYRVSRIALTGDLHKERPLRKHTNSQLQSFIVPVIIMVIMIIISTTTRIAKHRHYFM